MIHISLFSGIGGFELAAEWAGWKNYASCEINPFGQQVLEYYWPNAYHHSDIKTLTYELLNTELIQRFGTDWRNDDIIITGGFPCQPYSQAGKRLGKEDERHLWPEMLRFISEVKPTWVVGENVRGIINWSGGLVFDEVQTDLEALSYEVQPFLLPAAGVNAPHERYRTWFIAYNSSVGWKQGSTIRGTVSEKIGRPKHSVGSATQAENGITPNPESTEQKRANDSRTRRNGFTNICEPTSYAKSKRQPSFNRNKSEVVQTQTGSELYGRSCNRNDEPGTWSNFPTQPPVRGRNDGISSGLAGITVSKHRNESIKAYGNAIVPQVAFQIFKAINNFALNTTT